ncbi:MAG: polysaccharide deacetylase family protein [Kangiellaceae bacterium]|nr:polysaccharide deacetylase family protein [Kangiellaceae bacterium]
MDYLEENRFKVISLNIFIHHLVKQIPFDDKTVLITFDDGYDSIFDNALPILTDKKFPFTVFINAKPIEQKLSQWMTWQQLKTLQKNNGTIANHSYAHQHLIRRLENESYFAWSKRIEKDLLKNQKLLEQKLNISNKVLAYPYGEYDQLNLKPLLAKHGFYGFAQHSGAVSLEVDRQAIPRFAFGGVYGQIDDFKIKVNALPLNAEKLELLGSDGRAIADHVLTGEEYKTQLRVTLDNNSRLAQLQCFFSGQGKLEKEIKQNQAIFKLSQKIKPGRSRFNCTAPSKQKGRFYWFSQPIIRSLPGGKWYSE